MHLGKWGNLTHSILLLGGSDPAADINRRELFAGCDATLDQKIIEQNQQLRRVTTETELAAKDYRALWRLASES